MKVKKFKVVEYTFNHEAGGSSRAAEILGAAVNLPQTTATTGRLCLPQTTATTGRL